MGLLDGIGVCFMVRYQITYREFGIHVACLCPQVRSPGNGNQLFWRVQASNIWECSDIYIYLHTCIYIHVHIHLHLHIHINIQMGCLKLLDPQISSLMMLFSRLFYDIFTALWRWLPLEHITGLRWWKLAWSGLEMLAQAGYWQY